MPNRYANLPGAGKISETYTLINEGFDKVQQEMDAKPDSSIAQVNDLALGPDDTLIIEAGTGITVVSVPEEKKIRIVATGQATPGPHGTEHNHDGADPIPDLVDHLMTSAYKGSPQRYLYDYVNGFAAESTKGSSYYYKDQFNQVFCHISLKKSGNSDDIGTSYFTTLPVGFRPYQIVNAVIECQKMDNTRFHGRIEIYTSGAAAVYVPQSCAFVYGLVTFNTFEG